MNVTRFSTLKRLAVPLATTAAVAFLLLGQNANAAAFSMKGTESQVGSRIKPVIGSSSIPLDRGAADLSERERDALRQSFKKHAKGDEPAYLAHPLKELMSDLTDLRPRMSLYETVEVMLVIDETGQVRSTKVLEATSDRLATIVTKSIAAARFKPAQCDGTPCAMKFPVTLEVFGNPVVGLATEVTRPAQYKVTWPGAN